MNRSGDAPREMAEHLFLDADTQDRLLAGRVAADDAPPGYAEVAEFVRCLGHIPSSDATAAEGTARTMAMIVRENGADARPRRPRRKRLVARLAAVALATSLFGTTGAAFAGALPDPVQNFAAHVLSKIGISIPQAAAEVPDRSDWFDDSHVARPSESSPSSQPTASSDGGRNGTRSQSPGSHDGGGGTTRPDGEAPEDAARSLEPDEGSSWAESHAQPPVLPGAGSETAEGASGGHGQGMADPANQAALNAASDHQHGTGGRVHGP